MDEMMALNKTYLHIHNVTFLCLPEMDFFLFFIGKIPKTGQRKIIDTRNAIQLTTPHLGLNGIIFVISMTTAYESPGYIPDKFGIIAHFLVVPRTAAGAYYIHFQKYYQ